MRYAIFEWLTGDGSYAKGKATETSDIDLFVSDSITGLKFYELAEKLRESLHKKVDLDIIYKTLKDDIPELLEYLKVER